ncbi:MAG: dienelactone hydrolase family protein [Rhodospirillales bacterium]|nr:dienelactone hydrolase family protein [Rhodospirillales bacterium]MDE0379570.1 dienelactone hydrolase family protein [Rhodospirillales bacterium]
MGLARRDILVGLAGLPLAAVLADPRLARAAAAGLETVSITTAGGREVSAALGVPAALPAPAVILVHEWWGLNDQIKSVAAALADEGYLALAIDLYGGQVTDDPGRARELVRALSAEAATDACASWVGWLRGHESGTGKVGTVGWCFGGAWSLNASLAAPVDATVVYYGNVKKGRDRLASLAGPVLGHFATRDKWINEEMVGGFEAEMAAAGKSAENHWYEAHHGFANPTKAAYDEEDAALAWQRTLDFFAAHLG